MSIDSSLDGGSVGLAKIYLELSSIFIYAKRNSTGTGIFIGFLSKLEVR